MSRDEEIQISIMTRRQPQLQLAAATMKRKTRPKSVLLTRRKAGQPTR